MLEQNVQRVWKITFCILDMSPSKRQVHSISYNEKANLEGWICRTHLLCLRMRVFQALLPVEHIPKQQEDMIDMISKLFLFSFF